MSDQILTIKEVAEYLKVNERTIYRMATEKRSPAFQVGVSWRFKSEEVEASINSQHGAKA